MEEEQKFSFDQATIFVRKVLPDAVSSLNSLDSESTKDDDDPDFQEVATGFCHTHTHKVGITLTGNSKNLIHFPVYLYCSFYVVLVPAVFDFAVYIHENDKQ